MPKKIPLHTRVLLGLVIGAAAGIGANAIWGGDNAGIVWTIRHITEPVGTLFLRLLLMMVIPLVFSSLVVGVAGIGDIRALGRIGGKSVAYTLIISAISVVIAIAITNIIQPGTRVDPATAQALEEKYGADAQKRIESSQKGNSNDSPLMQIVKTIVPSNPLTAMASDPPNLLHLMFFALILGIGATLLSNSISKPMLDLCDSLFKISAKIIDLIMYAAPFAVACLLFTNIAQFGASLLSALAWFVITVLLGLSLQMFGVYSISVKLLSKLSPIDFFRRIKTIMLTAFSTSSSNATLPTSLAVTEHNLNVPRNINNFVLTVGATANQNGTAIYEGVTVLFLAQLAGIDLSLGQQIMVAYLAILGAIGTAGVPSGSIPFIVVVLATMNMNPTLIAIILGVERVLDMCRTTVNVAGDITAATYVAHSEGHALATTAEKNWI